jgi:hypothetical protein
MKRSLSFTNLKELTPCLEIQPQNVRKIQSCAARLQESDLSPDFFDALLEEYENQVDLDPIQCSTSATMIANRENVQSAKAPSLDQSKPCFTTHDLTELLSFLQPSNQKPQETTSELPAFGSSERAHRHPSRS